MLTFPEGIFKTNRIFLKWLDKRWTKLDICNFLKLATRVFTYLFKQSYLKKKKSKS